MAKLMPISLYCEAKYHGSKEGAECNEDPLCEHDAFKKECLPSITDYKSATLFFEASKAPRYSSYP